MPVNKLMMGSRFGTFKMGKGDTKTPHNANRGLSGFPNVAQLRVQKRSTSFSVAKGGFDHTNFLRLSEQQSFGLTKKRESGNKQGSGSKY